MIIATILIEAVHPEEILAVTDILSREVRSHDIGDVNNSQEIVTVTDHAFPAQSIVC